MFRKFVVASALALALLGDGGGYAQAAPAEACQTRTWTNNEGKTPNGTHAVATDGCNVYEFTTTIGAGPASGEKQFMVADLAAGNEFAAYSTANQCEYAAVAQANMAFAFYFKVPAGTMVNVKYDCQ